MYFNLYVVKFIPFAVQLCFDKCIELCNQQHNNTQCGSKLPTRFYQFPCAAMPLEKTHPQP